MSNPVVGGTYTLTVTPTKNGGQSWGDLTGATASMTLTPLSLGAAAPFTVVASVNVNAGTVTYDTRTTDLSVPGLWRMTLVIVQGGLVAPLVGVFTVDPR